MVRVGSMEKQSIIFQRDLYECLAWDFSQWFYISVLLGWNTFFILSVHFAVVLVPNLCYFQEIRHLKKCFGNSICGRHSNSQSASLGESNPKKESNGIKAGGNAAGE